MARDIAEVLGTPGRHEGYLTVAPDWCVTWAYGHLVTLAAPEKYNPAWKRWAWSTLPLLPESFLLEPVAKTAAQLHIVLRLIQDADTIISATDADREGELIFRYLYRMSRSHKRVDRLWLSENTPTAIRTALAALKPQADYDALAQAAEARSQADWLVGLNATRAFTLRHGVPSQGPLSVGRVQTPTLRLIADRDEEIAQFVSVRFWQVAVTFQADAGSYVGLYVGTNREHPHRILVRAEAEQILAKVPPGTSGRVVSVERKPVTIHPPLLYSLNDLQKEAHRRLGLSAQDTLNTAQSLYEKHFTSYPRTDARHITREIAGTLAGRLQKLKSLAVYAPLIDGLGRTLPTRRLVDDKKVAAAGHYAIIPTGQVPARALSPREQKIFDLVVRRLIAALMPAGLDERTVVVTAASDEHFRTRGVVVLKEGWRAAVGGTRSGSRARSDGTEGADEEDAEVIPPGLSEGAPVEVKASELRERETKPPPRLNDASLLALMEKHGLGTPATRAGVVEVLLTREYIIREAKALVTTEKGRGLLALVPATIQSPQLTGQWETQLEAIAGGQGDADAFLQAMRDYARELVEQARQQSGERLLVSDLGPCPVCGTGKVVGGKKAWGCSRWREGCRLTIWKTVAGKKITETQAKLLLAGKTTSVLKGFKSKAGKAFSARLRLQGDQVAFVFAAAREPGPSPKSPNAQRTRRPKRSGEARRRETRRGPALGAGGRGKVGE